MKLNDKQRAWIEQIIKCENFGSGYYNNMIRILELGEYDSMQAIIMNESVNPAFLEYIKKHRNKNGIKL